MIDQVGLTHPTREALMSIATIDEFKELDPATMGAFSCVLCAFFKRVSLLTLMMGLVAKIGIGLMERKHIQAFVATEYCRSIIPLPCPYVYAHKHPTTTRSSVRLFRQVRSLMDCVLCIVFSGRFSATRKPTALGRPPLLWSNIHHCSSESQSES